MSRTKHRLLNQTMLPKKRLTFHFLSRCVFLLLLGFPAVQLRAQLGPGGVSHETPNTLNPIQSDCRLWLSASSITTLADGDEVNVWNDISESKKNDKGFRNPGDNFIAPIFRNAPSASINGYPVVTFDNGGMLKVNTSTDLNTSITTTYEQTIIFAFRTSADVTSRQILWEEGGNWRGVNVFIYNGEIYLGAYDKHLDNDPGTGNVPGFGYNYVKTPIQPNTTYVLSHVFWAPANNTTNGYVKGYQNGSFFGTLINGGPHGPGIGGVHKHPDPIGIGGANSTTFNETGPIGNSTGQYTFKGRLAEICYYNRLLNNAERIIVENYLGAKYYANIIVNDKYAYQAVYGKDIIGIGQTTNSTNRHSVSQGRNSFEISPLNASASFNAVNEFLLIGSNGMPTDWTDDNVPNDPGSTKRMERIWRIDESGDLSTIKFRFHHSDLPPLPSGFTKYVLIFDNTSPSFPNFSTSNSEVFEIKDVGGGFYEVEVDVISGAFMTIGALKPQVSFTNAEAFAIEGDPSPDSTLYFNKAYARLNYVPTSPVKIDFSFTDGTATRAADYGYLNSDISNGITFPAGLQKMPLRLWVKNDVIQENPSTETFTINLTIGLNTTSGLGIGSQSQHTFTVYDNDPPPKIGFAQPTSQNTESNGSHSINIVRSGSTVGSASARVKIVYGSSTTASLNLDFQYPTYKTVSFADGEAIKTVSIDLLDDPIDENNEFIKLKVFHIFNAAAQSGSILHTFEVIDDDVPPTVEFTSTVSQNYETTGAPDILIEADQISSKDISVDYTKTELLTTAATLSTDYTLAYPATITIPAGDTLGYPNNFTVQQDGIAEDDETVEFKLTAATNANLGTKLVHTYTIKDYSTFEWKGAAGVGKRGDNIFWIDINRQSGSHNDPLQTLTNFSPHNIHIFQNTTASRASIQTTSNLINGRKTLHFDGNDWYRFADNGLINKGAQLGKRNLFFVIKTGSSVSGWQTIYKEGGGVRGYSIYIHNGTLYFNAMNNKNSDPGAPWGTGTGTPRYAKFIGIQPNTDYIVSCFFDKDANQKLRIYVNGAPGNQETGACGYIYSHSGNACIGAADGHTRYHNGNQASGRYFKGYFAEMLFFTEAPVNETRRKIIANHLSGKYNIPLAAGNQIFSLNTNYNHQIAGIGQLSEALPDMHMDSQGNGVVRIKSPSIVQDNSFLMWGSNTIPLTDTWPYSSSGLPTGIVERSGRVWQISKTGTINYPDVYIRYNQMLNAADFEHNDLKLLIHHNANGQDFTNATVVNADTLLSGYVVKFSGVNFSDGDFFTLGNSSPIIPLPIELLYFHAEEAGQTVVLNWATATEINNDYFAVQRAGKDLEFKTILTQVGAGISNTTNFYTDVDKNPLEGTSYYRLKQVDYDGNFTYSDPVSVYFEPEIRKDFEFWVYPNPTKSHRFTIANTGKIPLGEPVNLSLITLSGKTVYTQIFDPSNTTVHIQIPSTISRGIYLVTLHTKQFIKSYKVVIN